MGRQRACVGGGRILWWYNIKIRDDPHFSPICLLLRNILQSFQSIERAGWERPNNLSLIKGSISTSFCVTYIFGGSSKGNCSFHQKKHPFQHNPRKKTTGRTYFFLNGYSPITVFQGHLFIAKWKALGHYLGCNITKDAFLVENRQFQTLK